jgi:hypothetical protein
MCGECDAHHNMPWQRALSLLPKRLGVRFQSRFGVAAMQSKLATLSVQLPADSPAHPCSRALDGNGPRHGLAVHKKLRPHKFDPDLNADFEEICGLVTERFTREGALDPEFCRFVGLLPDLKNVKDRAVVREAKMIATYLDRDDIEGSVARRIIGGLADRLRPLSGLPALHVMFGLMLFFAALLVADLILSYFWQNAGWSIAAAAQYPGFYIFNVSPWLIIAVGTAGGLGSIVSILTRIQSFTALAGTDRRLLWMIGAMRPVIGIVFGLFMFAMLQAQILPFSFPEGPQSNFQFLAMAFVAGFSERWSLGVVSSVEGRFLGHKPE